MEAVDVTAHLPLVEQLARRLAARLPRRIDVDDLVGAGTLGLLEAAERYDSDRGVRFPDFARRRVQGAMLDTLRAIAPTTRGARRRRRSLDETRRDLAQSLGRPPEQAELAAELGLTEQELDQLEFSARPLRVLSFEELGVVPELQAQVAEALTSQEAGPLERLAAAEARRRVADAVTSLPERQRLVLSLYYVEDLRLREIGDMLGVTESRICQLHTAALRALRERLAATLD